MPNLKTTFPSFAHIWDTSWDVVVQLFVGLFENPWTAAPQVSLSFTSFTIWVCSNSFPWCRWCYLTFSTSAASFSFFLQLFPASGSFPMSRLFASGGQGIGASASVLSVNIEGWFHFRLTGSISLQSKGLSRVFSNTTVWRTGKPSMLQSMGSQRVRYDLVTEKQLIKFSVQFLKVTFHLQLLHNVGSFPHVVQ